MTNIRCKTFDEVLTSNHPTIGELASRSQQWTMFTLAYVSGAITNYLDFVGRRNTMNDEQAAETATLILDEYPTLKMDDIALFFRQCKLARYGKLYDLNGATLLDWLNIYRQERGAAEYKLYEKQRKAQEAAEEAKRQAEWDALTPEQQAEQKRQIDEIVERMTNKRKIII